LLLHSYGTCPAILCARQECRALWRKMDNQSDTIAAIATPAGEGGIAVIRVSGSKAGDIARAVWRRMNRDDCPPLETHRVYHGHVINPETNAVIDECLLIYFEEGRSYTGDEVIEINCHGGPFVARRVLEAVLAAGARPAGPGEFTRRAFLAGRLDLAQAEAVADLIAASSDRELANARMQLEGALSRQVGEVAERLTETLAEIESRIDFPEEEDIGALPTERLKELLGASHQKLTGLAEGFKEGRVLREGYRLTIVGRPNVGKSSLLNRLLGVDRAIVTAEAGTTRDVIEERVVWRGMPFLLVDTAGVRNARVGSPEYMAAEKSRERARYHAADPSGGVLLVVLDASEPLADEDIEVLDMAREAPHLLIFNKCDLRGRIEPSKLPGPWRKEKAIHVSALTGEGMKSLVDAVARRREEGGLAAKSEGYLLSSARHYAAVKRAIEAVNLATAALNEGRPHEIIALEVRLAREALDGIVGAAGVEDVLDIIFSRFCIGK